QPSTQPLLPLHPSATTEPSTLSLHAALPISRPRPRKGPATAPARSTRLRTAPARERPRERGPAVAAAQRWRARPAPPPRPRRTSDRKSTRLNSSHVKSSYAVFCLKKKRKKKA